MTRSSNCFTLITVVVVVVSLVVSSGMTRDSAEHQESFLDCDGFSTLLRAMQAEEEKLQTKAAFMIRAMLLSDARFKGESVPFISCSFN